MAARHYGVPLGIPCESAGWPLWGALGYRHNTGSWSIYYTIPCTSCGVFDLRGSRQISMQAWLLGSLLRVNKVFFRAFFRSEQVCPVNEYFDLFMVILYKNTGKVEKDVILWKLIKDTKKISLRYLQEAFFISAEIIKYRYISYCS